MRNVMIAVLCLLSVTAAAQGTVSRGEYDALLRRVEALERTVEQLVKQIGLNPFPNMMPVGGCQAVAGDGYVILTARGGDTAKFLTKKMFRPPFELTTVAMTDSTNIRLYYAKGIIILNWERKKDELRVHDPKTGKWEAFPGKGLVEAHKWHKIVWSVGKGGMEVLVDGELRYRGRGDFTGIEAPVGIGPAWGSTVSVKSFDVKQR